MVLVISETVCIFAPTTVALSNLTILIFMTLCLPLLRFLTLKIRLPLLVKPIVICKLVYHTIVAEESVDNLLGLATVKPEICFAFVFSFFAYAFCEKKGMLMWCIFNIRKIVVYACIVGCAVSFSFRFQPSPTRCIAEYPR